MKCLDRYLSDRELIHILRNVTIYREGMHDIYETHQQRGPLSCPICYNMEPQF